MYLFMCLALFASVNSIPITEPCDASDFECNLFLKLDQIITLLGTSGGSSATCDINYLTLAEACAQEIASPSNCDNSEVISILNGPFNSLQVAQIESSSSAITESDIDHIVESIEGDRIPELNYRVPITSDEAYSIVDSFGYVYTYIGPSDDIESFTIHIPDDFYSQTSFITMDFINKPFVDSVDYTGDLPKLINDCLKIKIAVSLVTKRVTLLNFVFDNNGQDYINFEISDVDIAEVSLTSTSQMDTTFHVAQEYAFSSKPPLPLVGMLTACIHGPACCFDRFEPYTNTFELYDAAFLFQDFAALDTAQDTIRAPHIPPDDGAVFKDVISTECVLEIKPETEGASCGSGIFDCDLVYYSAPVKTHFIGVDSYGNLFERCYRKGPPSVLRTDSNFEITHKTYLCSEHKYGRPWRKDYNLELLFVFTTSNDKLSSPSGDLTGYYVNYNHFGLYNYSYITSDIVDIDHDGMNDNEIVSVVAHYFLGAIGRDFVNLENVQGLIGFYTPLKNAFENGDYQILANRTLSFVSELIPGLDTKQFVDTAQAMVQNVINIAPNIFEFFKKHGDTIKNFIGEVGEVIQVVTGFLAL